MADQPTKPPVQIPMVSIPGLGAGPVVAVRLPSGQVVLRHPDELQKPNPPAPAGGGGS